MNRQRLIDNIFGRVGKRLNTPSKEVVDYVLSTLTIQEQQVLRLRDYGLKYQEIAKIVTSKRDPECYVSETYVQQLHSKALRKLRHPSRSGYLIGKYLEELIFEMKTFGKLFPDVRYLRDRGYGDEVIRKVLPILREDYDKTNRSANNQADPGRA